MFTYSDERRSHFTTVILASGISCSSIWPTCWIPDSLSKTVFTYGSHFWLHFLEVVS